MAFPLMLAISLFVTCRFVVEEVGCRRMRRQQRQEGESGTSVSVARHGPGCGTGYWVHLYIRVGGERHSFEVVTKSTALSE
jgi:hypothetical protein